MQAARRDPAEVNDIRIVADTGSHAIAVVGDLSVHRLRGELTMPYLEHSIEGQTAALAGSIDGKYSLVVAIEAATPMPSADVRRRSAELWTTTQPLLRGH